MEINVWQLILGVPSSKPQRPCSFASETHRLFSAKESISTQPSHQVQDVTDGVPWGGSERTGEHPKPHSGSGVHLLPSCYVKAKFCTQPWKWADCLN